MLYRKDDSMLHTPHSPYIAQRDSLDGGFSKGWGFHFSPSEEYVVDCHAHCDFEGTPEELSRLLDRWFAYTDAYRQQKIVAFVQKESQFSTFQQLQQRDERLQWMFWPETGRPELSQIQRAKSMGACGLKLHSKPIMSGEVPFSIWESALWQEIFSWLEQNQMPVLWHVTQRVSYSPYHGGGYNAYFADGQKKGVNVTNQQLLEQLRRILEQYPALPIIGAHQLYLGLDALSRLFDQYPNLYIDTSVGCFVRWCDQLYEEDRQRWYDFFTRYPDRILFGTDTDLSDAGICEYQKEAFVSHLRFIHHLRLPYETLQMVCWRNAERILSIPASSSVRKFNTRP